MPLPAIFNFRGSVIVAGLALGIALAPAETSAADKTEVKSPKSEDFNTLTKLRDGELDWKAEHKTLLKDVANWYVSRLNSKEVWEPSSDTKKTINDLVNEVCGRIPLPEKLNPQGAKRDRQKVYLQKFTEALTPEIEELLKDKDAKPIARVNAARILAHLGAAGQEEAADLMVKVLDDKEQGDEVKFFALQGLKNLFSATDGIKNQERESRCIRALLEFLNRPQPQDMQVEAFHYVRREAVRALAQTHRPAVVQNKKVIAQPGLELLRVVSKDNLTPEPSISEQVEAAIGVCQLQSKLSPDYQPDYAAHHLGHFIAEFAVAYGQDRAKQGQGQLLSEPWKKHAIQLRQALGTMKADKSDKYVSEMIEKSDDLLRSVEDGKPVQAGNFRDWLDKNPPKNKQLFKGDEKSVVKLPAAGG